MEVIEEEAKQGVAVRTVLRRVEDVRVPDRIDNPGRHNRLLAGHREEQKAAVLLVRNERLLERPTLAVFGSISLNRMGPRSSAHRRARSSSWLP